MTDELPTVLSDDELGRIIRRYWTVRDDAAYKLGVSHHAKTAREAWRKYLNSQAAVKQATAILEQRERQT